MRYDLRGPQPVPAPSVLARLQEIRNSMGSAQLYYNELNDQAIVLAGKELVVLGSDANGLFPAHRLQIDQLLKSISSILFIRVAP